ncbi:MAG: purine-nucleoside phosphorylase [Proteobacteria bacterium]|nr:purine-nucleoside phosphorylase [Pseudomonadota bacterium]MBU1584575.1 purine-nucleoside phosphorylase [Pseudomonadota bacterium]MBU2451742.1 purine-nucleoside phosphorylase [Pseudomonadota bacterium]MBU2630677.1 purine-nucleoside phosphorylase [Pseudomonadota bacterium]
MLDQIQQAADFISSRILEPPQFGIILGSGLGSFADQLESKVTIAFEDIPHFPVSTVEGHEGKMVIGKLENTVVLVLQGRFHYYEGYSMDQVVFPVRCMLYLNIPNLIVTNAAGSVDMNYKPGDLMLIKDHIKFHADSPLRGPNISAFGPRFNDMSDPYTHRIRTLAKAAAKRLDIPIKEGVYYYMGGPSYETASEIKAIRILGANAVGMSTVPEVIVASHGGMNVLGLSCITNMATGILDHPIGHEDVIKTSATVKEKFITLLKSIISQWANL